MPARGARAHPYFVLTIISRPRPSPTRPYAVPSPPSLSLRLNTSLSLRRDASALSLPPAVRPPPPARMIHPAADGSNKNSSCGGRNTQPALCVSMRERERGREGGGSALFFIMSASSAASERACFRTLDSAPPTPLTKISMFGRLPHLPYTVNIQHYDYILTCLKIYIILYYVLIDCTKLHYALDIQSLRPWPVCMICSLRQSLGLDDKRDNTRIFVDNSRLSVHRRQRPPRRLTGGDAPPSQICEDGEHGGGGDRGRGRDQLLPAGHQSHGARLVQRQRHARHVQRNPDELRHKQ